MKVLIIGSYGAGNLGDEAILSVLLARLSGKHACAVLSGNPDDTKKRHGGEVHPHFPFGLRSFLRFNWFSSLRALRKSSLVLLGGGGLFTDTDSSKAVYLWTWHVFVARLFRKPVVLFANSVGPIRGRFNRFLAKCAFKSCQKLIVRDELSKKELEVLGFKKVQVGFDPVVLFGNVKKNSSVKKIAINFRPLRDSVDLGALVDSLKKTGKELVFVATDPSDRALMQPFGKVHSPKDFSELIALLNSCESCVGMRLHFLLAGVLAGCKVYGLSYNLKVAGILKALGLDYASLPFTKIDLKKAKHASHVEEASSAAESMFRLL